jgi:hypothetical protein
LDWGLGPWALTWNLHGRGLGHPGSHGGPPDDPGGEGPEVTRPLSWGLARPRPPGLTPRPPQRSWGRARGYPAAAFAPKNSAAVGRPFPSAAGGAQGAPKGALKSSPPPVTPRALGRPFPQLLPGPRSRTEHPRRGCPLPSFWLPFKVQAAA